MSAFLSTKRPPWRKKAILAKVCFDAKKRLVCEYDKMNIYFKKPPFVPYLGLFAAKCTAICCKMQCNMPLNAVRFGAKCSAF